MNQYITNRVFDWLEDLEAVEKEYGAESQELAYQMRRTLDWLTDYDNLKQVMKAALLHAPYDHSTRTAEGAEERQRKYIASIPARIQGLQQ